MGLVAGWRQLGSRHLGWETLVGRGLSAQMNPFEFPQHKSFRGIKEFQETTREVLELESRAAAVKSSKKKGKLTAQKKKKQAQLSDEYADLIHVEAEFKRKEKMVAYGFAIFVPFCLVGSYAPFVPLPYYPLLFAVSLLPVAAICVIYRESSPPPRPKTWR
eukprot:COSAG02_NODE_129_length_34796_cov_26.576015_1_plen_161_part_00